MPVHNKGKKGRKIGKGIEKVKHSRWLTYKNIIDASTLRKHKRLANRQCPECKTYLQSRGALKRHILRATCAKPQAVEVAHE